MRGEFIVVKRKGNNREKDEGFYRKEILGRGSRRGGGITGGCKQRLFESENH